jgi:hypothetical protein
MFQNDSPSDNQLAQRTCCFVEKEVKSMVELHIYELLHVSGDLLVDIASNVFGDASLENEIAEKSEHVRPLYDAASKGEMDIDDSGLTPLACAVSCGKVIAARYFINKDADLNKQDRKGFTPLHYAATKVNEGMPHLLISRVACVDVPVVFVWCCDETMVTSWLLLLDCVGWQSWPPPMLIENFDGCGMICPMSWSSFILSYGCYMSWDISLVEEPLWPLHFQLNIGVPIMVPAQRKCGGNCSPFLLEGCQLEVIGELPDCHVLASV